MENSEIIQEFLVQLNEWMKWLLIYRLSSGQWPDLKAVYSTYHRLTDGLPTWVEQSKDTYSWSTSSFPTIIYSGSIISFFLCHSYSLFLCPHIFIFIYTVHAGCLYVTDTLSTPTITEPPSVECQDLLIPCQIECMCGQNRPQFIVPSERHVFWAKEIADFWFRYWLCFN